MISCEAIIDQYLVHFDNGTAEVIKLIRVFNESKNIFAIP